MSISPWNIDHDDDILDEERQRPCEQIADPRCGAKKMRQRRGSTRRHPQQPVWRQDAAAVFATVYMMALGGSCWCGRGAIHAPQWACMRSSID
ncbi:uncharacterized protein K460DRAFT_371507 [Cucurbitaria berberidis CBS 394.84]|uniref:Uncharacterized protein n=1 Tax=Cucurbitaria berberidis CBS 394.84 TaxID=1168544 RepID=A0A9P4G769_9PLEO|nr:uncharacterized protein K460DRAFT_371507 [Cucurbitaria berberidis CBS 394.84]KAF1840302.1 hypothetical protein K460DRAFT_371507 [Cucurbitaria berberidis CBS 394.84]